MRRSPGKEFGYVMVPLFVEQAADESIDEALKRTGFDDVWDLLGSMREQDEVLVDIIRQMQEDKGRIGGYDESRFSERVEILGPSVSLDTIRESITAECLESLGVSWDEWFGRLFSYVERERHCLVPQRYLTSDGERLGQWVSSQRTARSTLPIYRRIRLEALPGWVWDAIAEQWEIGFRYLAEFAKHEGNARVLSSYQTIEEYRLGEWVVNQRRAEASLSAEQKSRLEAVPGWMWDVHVERWDIAYSYLREFADREGHCRVHQHYLTSNGFHLGRWVSNQRTKKVNLSTDQMEQLEAVTGWAWNALDEKWELGFRYLTEFIDREGHCLLPQKFRTAEGFSLGNWVSNQRAAQDSMPVEQKLRLETIPGWVWDVRVAQWDIGFRHLAEFVGREGHCKVKQNYQTSDRFRLGQWASTQRRNQNILPIERRNLLEALSGWAWDRFADKWETGFRHLTEFSKRERHCQVPHNYLTTDGYRLGQWLKQQKADDGLPLTRKDLLDALPGWEWREASGTDQWDTGFSHLSEFVAREGHCQVPRNYLTTDGYRLGQWVLNQRKVRDTLSTEHKDLLELLLGWTWDRFAEQWEMGFRYLTEFVAREGHCQVPRNYLTTDGYRLGGWVSRQRTAKNDLSATLKERLEALPKWQW